MHPTDPYRSEPGWPRWALWAAIPVMLSLGFVTGLALATYLPAQTPPLQAEAPASSTQPAPSAIEPGQTPGANPGADQSWKVPESGLLANKTLPGLVEPPPLPDPGLPVSPQPGLPVPSSVYSLGPPLTAREARATLSREFFRYAAGSTAIRFEYQEMLHAGDGRTLVGMISVDDYKAWEIALGSNSGALERWLEAAAKKVQPAAQRDRFHLSWAVMETVSIRPPGFADYEVTELNDGTFLVTRPLAATIDYGSTRISLRSLENLRLSTAGLPMTAGSPWATYRPLLRWDSADIYRPTSAMPLSR